MCALETNTDFYHILENWVLMLVYKQYSIIGIKRDVKNVKKGYENLN